MKREEIERGSTIQWFSVKDDREMHRSWSTMWKSYEVILKGIWDIAANLYADKNAAEQENF
jgi:hypothetical protein